MATPHLAGAVALCLDEGGVPGPCAGLTPSQIAARTRSDAEATTLAHPWFGFTGDPLRPASGRYFGHLAFAGAGAPVRPVSTTTTATPSSVTVTTGTLSSGGAAALAADDSSLLRVNSTTTKPRSSAWYGTFTGIPAPG